MRNAFSSWSEVEFAWQKVEPFARPAGEFLVSPTGLFVCGVLWLTAVLLRPAAVTKRDIERADAAEAKVQELERQLATYQTLRDAEREAGES